MRLTQASGLMACGLRFDTGYRLVFITYAGLYGSAGLVCFESLCLKTGFEYRLAGLAFGKLEAALSLQVDVFFF